MLKQTKFNSVRFKARRFLRVNSFFDRSRYAPLEIPRSSRSRLWLPNCFRRIPTRNRHQNWLRWDLVVLSVWVRCCMVLLTFLVPWILTPPLGIECPVGSFNWTRVAVRMSQKLFMIQRNKKYYLSNNQSNSRRLQCSIHHVDQEQGRTRRVPRCVRVGSTGVGCHCTAITRYCKPVNSGMVMIKTRNNNVLSYHRRVFPWTQLNKLCVVSCFICWCQLTLSLCTVWRPHTKWMNSGPTR